jgi:hypothetical protein
MSGGRRKVSLDHRCSSGAARSDLGCKVRPDLCHGGAWGPIENRPTEYLRQMYYDTMVFSEEALRHLVAEVGA